MNKLIRERKIKAIILTLTILLSTAVSAFFMYSKQGFHEDELLTFNLANSSVQINPSNDFITPDDINAYLSVSDGDRFNYALVYENQIRDGVHPPLYYILFNSVCSLFPCTFSKWLPFALNAVFMAFALLFIYKIARLITGRFKYSFTAMAAYAFSIACVTTVIYIRMYAMLTFFTTAFSYVTLLMYCDGPRKNKKHIAAMALVCLFGNLTHYYFILFELLTGITMLIITLRKKRARVMKKYIITGILSGCASLCAYPFIIANVLLGNRGLDSGGLSIDLITLLTYVVYKLSTYALIIAKDLFVNKVWLFALVSAALVAALIYMRVVRKKKISPKTKIIFFPSLIFLIGISLVSPFNSDRYIMCVLPLLVIVAVTSFIRLFRLIKLKYSYAIITLSVIIVSVIGLLSVKPYYTYGMTDLYNPQTKTCLFVGTSMQEWTKSLDKLMQYDKTLISQTELDMGFVESLDSFAEERGVKTNGKIAQFASYYIDSANASDEKNNLNTALENGELDSEYEITVYISQLCSKEKVISYIRNNTSFNAYELIQADCDFNDYYNWYDYFAETESYCNVYRFYKEKI